MSIITQDNAAFEFAQVQPDSEDTSLTRAASYFATQMQASTVHSLEEISILTGGFVRFIPELGYLPAIIGNDNEPVYLYNLIEGLSEFVNYDGLLAEYPNLNYVQISGALSFLRKVAQANTSGVDIDELEDEFDFNNDEFLHNLRGAFEQRGEVARVLVNGD